MFGEVLKHSIITIKTAMEITLPINAILNCFPSPGILSAFASYSLQSAGQKYSCTKVGDTRRARGSNFGRETTFYRRPIIPAPTMREARRVFLRSEQAEVKVVSEEHQRLRYPLESAETNRGIQGYTGVSGGIIYPGKHG